MEYIETTPKILNDFYDSSNKDSMIIHHTPSKSTQLQLNSEKLKLSFNKYNLQTQVITVKNRISKLIRLEKSAEKDVCIAKSFHKEKQKKLERNIQKIKEKELIKQQRLEDLLAIKKHFQIEKIRRENLKKIKQHKILAEKQEFVRELKKTEKVWKNEIEQFKHSKVQEKKIKRDLVKRGENRSKRKRCISQMTYRKAVKENYEERVGLLKLQHDQILSNLSNLQDQHELLNKHVEKVLEKRDKTLQSLEKPLDQLNNLTSQ